MAERRPKKVSKKKRRQRRMIRRLISLAGVFAAVVAAIVLIIFAAKNLGKDSNDKKEEETAVQSNEEAVLPANVTVDGYKVSDYSREQLKELLMNVHPWNIVISGSNGEITLDNAISSSIDKILDKAYSDSVDNSYSVALTDDEKAGIISNAVSMADTSFSDSVSSNNVMEYNEDSGEFVFHDAKPRNVVDTGALETALRNVLDSGNYESSIPVSYNSIESDLKADSFKLIGKYVTHTTANKDRNVNVTLACKSVNGTILQPGDQFSYNECLGKRTEEKGYKPAGAYSNGEHVLELGGGVCQLSSTLYNAVFAANLQVDERTGHTYEPTYVTPGEDATVSYANPDFKFTNSTSGPVGIKVTFADRTVTVQIYGLPTLEEGVTRRMKSEKTGDLEAPEPVYVENLAIVPGFELETKAAKLGSKWVTYEVLEKDGEIIKEEYLHTTSYKGEPATIERNSSGIYVAPGTEPVVVDPNAGMPNEEGN